jgi:hypothetical protein
MEFVSFETAMKMRSLGYNVPGRLWSHVKYDDSNELFKDSAINDWNTMFKNVPGHEYMCTAPTLEEAQRWLRNVKGIHIMLDCIGAENWKPTVQEMYGAKDYVIEGTESRMGFNGFDSYEIALEVAINDVVNKLVEA